MNVLFVGSICERNLAWMVIGSDLGIVAGEDG